MLEELEDHLEGHPEAGLAYCRLRIIDGEGRLKGNRGSWPPRHGSGRFARPRVIPDEVAETPMVSILDFVAIMPSVSLFRLSVLDRAGGWDERYSRGGAEDTALAVEVALQSAVHFVPRIWCATAVTIARRAPAPIASCTSNPNCTRGSGAEATRNSSRRGRSTIANC